MAPDDHASQVSLPSIHEMLPGWDLPSSSELQWSRFAGDPRHSYTTKARIWSPDGNGSQSSLGRPMDNHAYRCVQPAKRLVPSTHSPESLGSQCSHDVGPLTVSVPFHAHKPIYSFDVLKPHPVTASLMNVASSTDITSVRVAPHSPNRSRSPVSNGTHTELTVISVQKAKPAFRVHLPPSSPSSGYGTEDASSLERGQMKSYARRSCLQFPPSLLPDPLPQDFEGPQHSFQPSPTIMQDAADDKKHCCPHCEKRFNRPSSLSIHVNTHTGAKPFQCPYPGCSRRFNVNSNMRRHYRNHISARRRESAAPHMAELDKAHQSYGATFDTASPYTANTTLHKSYLSRSRSSSLSALDEEEDNGEQRALVGNGVPTQGFNLMDGGGLSPTNSSPGTAGGSKQRFLSSVADCNQEDALQMLANVTECFHRTNSRTRY